jgi:hypothetical protein
MCSYIYIYIHNYIGGDVAILDGTNITKDRRKNISYIYMYMYINIHIYMYKCIHIYIYT